MYVREEAMNGSAGMNGLSMILKAEYMIASSIENALSIRLVLFLLKVVHLVSQKITVNVMYRVKHLTGSLGHLGFR